MSFTRWDFLIGTSALTAGTSVSTSLFLPKYHYDHRARRSRVAVLRAEQYCQKLNQILREGLRPFPIDVRRKMVVLKPNLVDYLPGSAINTHPMLGLAAAETFRRLGAESVVVAEGRDINGILSCCYARVVTRNPWVARSSNSSISSATN